MRSVVSCVEDVEAMRAERLLVVDDMPAMCRLIGSIAADAGYWVETTSNAIDFKATYESFRPTVVVLDLLIPDEDGIELLWYLHRNDYDGAIIIISGATKTMHIAAQTMAKGLRLCVADSFAKPFNVVKLHDSLMALRGAPTSRTA